MKRPFLTLLLLFTVVPLLELTLLIEIGKRTSLLFTVALIVLTGVLGAYLARREGFKAIARLREDLREGRAPAAAAIDGILVLIAGAVLLTPGLLTDCLGFSLLLPAVRERVRRVLTERFRRSVEVRVQSFRQQMAGGRDGQPTPDDVIDVEYSRVPDDRRADSP